MEAPIDALIPPNSNATSFIVDVERIHIGYLDNYGLHNLLLWLRKVALSHYLSSIILLSGLILRVETFTGDPRLFTYFIFKQYFGGGNPKLFVLLSFLISLFFPIARWIHLVEAQASKDGMNQERELVCNCKWHLCDAMTCYILICMLVLYFIHSYSKGNPNMVMALDGNKVDLLDARKVTVEVYMSFCFTTLLMEFFN